jgi:hypothetical protein
MKFTQSFIWQCIAIATYKLHCHILLYSVLSRDSVRLWTVFGKGIAHTAYFNTQLVTILHITVTFTALLGQIFQQRTYLYSRAHALGGSRPSLQPPAVLGLSHNGSWSRNGPHRKYLFHYRVRVSCGNHVMAIGPLFRILHVCRAVS